MIMAYADRFIATDNLIIHLKTAIGTITDPAIQANYAGFLSVSSVTVYELAIKDIFFEFASKKNKVFGAFVEKRFRQLNGRIKISDLKGEHIKPFGDKYLKKFENILQAKESHFFSTLKISIPTDYGNLITCRHKYVHGGYPTLTMNEVINCYNSGKEILHCLDDSMKR